MRLKFFGAILTLSLLTLAGAQQESLPENYNTEAKKLFPALQTFRQESAFTYLLLDSSGKTLGKLHLEDPKRFPRQTAYGGEIEVGIVTNPAGKIAGVVTGKHGETPSYMKRLASLKFFQRWNRLTLQEAQEKKVDAVTRATYSSEAIIHGVQSAVQTALAEEKK